MALEYATLLRNAGLRATPGRLALLGILEGESNPISVQQLQKKLEGALNQVTLYRALEALRKAEIVSRVHLEHEHAHFELAVGRSHHHHAICRDCGLIEDIEVPHATSPELDAAKQAKSFARISDYSLEFFGICKQCA